MGKYQGKNATYEFSVDNNKKIFHAQASGFFAVEDGTSFLSEYNQITKTFPSNEYSLIIDAAELKPSSPEVANMLGTLLQRYMEVPFRKRFLITKGNPVTQSQFSRLGKTISGWTESVQYVNDFNEAVKKI